MIVVNTNEAALAELNDEIVQKGPVNRRLLLSDKDTSGFGATLVTFDAGAKLNFHTHDSEQILYITDGKGILATKDKEYVVTPGCIVFIPAAQGTLFPCCYLAVLHDGMLYCQRLCDGKYVMNYNFLL